MTENPPSRLFPPVSSLPCPGCGQTELRATSDGEDTRFVCLGCGTCWLLDLGWFARVDPALCRGCQFRSVCTGVDAKAGGAARTLVGA